MWAPSGQPTLLMILLFIPASHCTTLSTTPSQSSQQTRQKASSPQMLFNLPSDADANAAVNVLAGTHCAAKTRNAAAQPTSSCIDKIHAAFSSASHFFKAQACRFVLDNDAEIQALVDAHSENNAQSVDVLKAQFYDGYCRRSPAAEVWPEAIAAIERQQTELQKQRENRPGSGDGGEQQFFQKLNALLAVGGDDEERSRRKFADTEALREMVVAGWRLITSITCAGNGNHSVGVDGKEERPSEWRRFMSRTRKTLVPAASAVCGLYFLIPAAGTAFALGGWHIVLGIVLVLASLVLMVEVCFSLYKVVSNWIANID